MTVELVKFENFVRCEQCGTAIVAITATPIQSIKDESKYSHLKAMGAFCDICNNALVILMEI